MDVRNDELVTIPNVNRKETTVQEEYTVLSKSIDANDITYIQELLMSESRYEEVDRLSSKKKEKLLGLLVEFLDHPLRIDAIKMIYHVMNAVGDATRLGRSLLEKSNDFNKLIHLKGKIDFLKCMQRRATQKSKPQHEYVDKE